jgi:hypothetical protein
MWDAVKISGTWYMADPTWDDAGNTAVYNYFLKGTNYYADKDHKLQNTNFFDGNGNPITEDGITEPPEISAEDYQYTSSASKKVTPITSAKTKTVSGIVYKINGKTATVQKASSKKIKSAVIAAKVKIGGKTYKVTSISANAFKGCRKLAKVTIKSTSLKSIGRNAFKGIKKTAVFKTGKKKYKKYKKLIAKKTTGYTKKMKIKK